MKEKSNKDNTSGKVYVEKNKIYWIYDNKAILEIDANDILVIGEYTNTDGPWFDDWFMTFVTKDGNWRSIPWYVDNRDELTQFLCAKFQPDLNLSFMLGSTDWDSVVRYPLKLKGQKLFKIIPSDKYKHPKTFLDKVIASIGLGKFDTSFSVDLTDEVKQELKNISK